MGKSREQEALLCVKFINQVVSENGNLKNKVSRLEKTVKALKEQLLSLGIVLTENK